MMAARNANADGRIMQVRKLAAGALIAAAVTAPTLSAPTAQADTTTTTQSMTALDFLVEGPFETLSACNHRADFWDRMAGPGHYCVYHDGTSGYRRGWWVYAQS
jgi:hypothetical protein